MYIYRIQHLYKYPFIRILFIYDQTCNSDVSASVFNNYYYYYYMYSGNYLSINFISPSHRIRSTQGHTKAMVLYPFPEKFFFC